MVTPQDVPHRQLVDAMPQVRERPRDATIAPRRILFRHADHELLDLLRDTRAARLSTLPAPINLLGDQSLVPPQEGIRCSDGRHRFEARAAEWVGQRSKSPALGIGEAELAAAEVGFEHTVFHEEIRDDLLLAPLDPAGDHGNQGGGIIVAPEVGSNGFVL